METELCDDIYFLVTKESDNNNIVSVDKFSDMEDLLYSRVSDIQDFAFSLANERDEEGYVTFSVQAFFSYFKHLNSKTLEVYRHFTHDFGYWDSITNIFDEKYRKDLSKYMVSMRVITTDFCVYTEKKKNENE